MIATGPSCGARPEQAKGPANTSFSPSSVRSRATSLVTYDIRLQRVQIFDAEGELVRTLPVEPPWRESRPRSAVGVSGRHLVMNFTDGAYGGAWPNVEGVVRWPGIRIGVLDLSAGTIHAVSDFPGQEGVIERTGESVAHIGYDFGKGPRFAVAPGTLAAVDTEAYHIRLFSLEDGRTARILHRDIVPPPVTTAHVDAEIEEYIETNVLYGGVSREQAEEMARGRREDPRAPTLPILRSIRLDATGNLWVEPFFGAGIDVGPFEVFAADGTWLGSVSVPPGLERGFIPDFAPGLGIGDDYILGVWRDAQDIQHVRLYPLVKP